MSNGSKKYKVFFPVKMSDVWLGGVNYYKNLFHAISLLENQPIEVYVPENNPDVILKYANKVKENKKDLYYYFEKYKARIFNKPFNKQEFLFRNWSEFDVISHSNYFNDKYTTTFWIPDFQHKKLPELFKESEINTRDKLFEAYSQKSSCVILSSNDAKKDFQNYYPEYAHKAKVLNFVSYISPDIYEKTENKRNEINEKYKLPEKYFFVPNQFWRHKNHITVLKAINELKKQNIDIQVVFSGNTSDYRNKNYFNDVILKYIYDNNLENNVHILGIIGLDEVYCLMRYCISIINPSLFEGWSSTVEEAKSIGKNMILSDLDVHKEQNPPNSLYFCRENYKELAEILKEKWQNSAGGADYELEETAKSLMIPRMKKFGKNYLSIIEEISKGEE